MDRATRLRPNRALQTADESPTGSTKLSISALAFAGIAIAGTAIGGIAIAGCKADPPPISADVVGLLSGDSEGYARASGPRDIEFPADHGAHPEYRTEWWYYTGNLVERETADRGGEPLFGEAGRRFGFQLTVFRSALDPAPDAPESAWGSGQAYLAHFTLTDVESDAFSSAERLSRGDAGLAGAVANPMRVWVETWEIAELDPGADGSGSAEGGGNSDDADFGEDRTGASAIGPRVRLRAADGPVSIDLVLTPRKSAAFHGDNGYSRKGPEPGNASYYYSLSRQAAEGSVTTEDGAFEVEGLAWMDHEWSTSALSKGQTGWDWLSLQLDDGREVMVFHIREEDGGVAPASSGSVIGPDGTVTHLAREDFELIPSGEWVSPRTGGRYPSVWQLGLNLHMDRGVNLTSTDLELEVVPLIADQELDVTIRYWEGAVRASGRDAVTGRRIEGFGYLEMTGYVPSRGRESGFFLP